MDRQPLQDPAETMWNIKLKQSFGTKAEFHPAE